MNVTISTSSELAVAVRQGAYNGSLGNVSSHGWAFIHTATLASCLLLLILIFFLGSYGNLVVFLSFFDSAFRKFRTNFDFMILNLSFCDLFVCCVTTPMFALVLFLDAGGGTGGGGVSKEFCFAFHLTSSGFVIMSLKTVAVIALHRLRMALGQQPNRTSSLPWTLALTALLWTTSFTLAALVALRARPWRTSPCVPRPGPLGGEARVTLCLYLADFGFCVAAVSASYAMIARALRRNSRVRRCPVVAVDGPVPVPALYRNQAYNKLPHMQTHPYARRGAAPLPPHPPGLVSSSSINLAKDSRAVATCAVIVLSLLFCCLPMAVSLARDALALDNSGSFGIYQFQLCGLTLVFLKSGINPFVYSRNSAGLRRRGPWCPHCFLPCCPLRCGRKTRLRAVGGGGLEVNRNKSSHHDTNSAYVLSPKPLPPCHLVDQACGPSRARDSAPSPRPAGTARRTRPASTSTPINTRIEPYYSIYNSSPSDEPSSPNSLLPVHSTFNSARPYVATQYHTRQDLDSTSAHPIPVPSV